MPPSRPFLISFKSIHYSLASNYNSIPLVPLISPLNYHQQSSPVIAFTTLCENRNRDNSNRIANNNFSENSPNMSSELGQVKIHSKQEQEQKQQQPKTQAELEKEKWMEEHRIACENNRKKYIDPKTGYSVMTELLHTRRGYCCGNACRHCPYNNENVGVPPEIKKANIQRGKQRRREIEAKEGKPVWADDDSDNTYSD